MAQKTVYFDSETELELYSNEDVLHLELSQDGYEPSMIIDLNSEDVETLISELQVLYDKISMFAK